MIFNLFKSKKKWQHKDSNVRIAAINEELDSNNSDNKETLLSLLNTDSSELVRRAVLLKFNDFDDYYTASITNDNKAIQEFSYTQVQDILLETHAIKLSLSQKVNFLNTLLTAPTINFSLLNNWLEHETEPKIIIELFQAAIKNKNTSSFFLQTFIKKNNSVVQTQLLSIDLKELNEPAFLTKLLKKSASDDVTSIIEGKLAQLVEQQEKPLRLHKQCQLILSKLLALKDLSDYGQYLTKKSALVQEWQDCLPEFSSLVEEEQLTLIQKYETITTKLKQLFAPKEEAYQQEVIAQQLAQNKKMIKNNVAKEVSALNHVITTAVFEGEILNEKDFLNQIAKLNQQLELSV